MFEVIGKFLNSLIQKAIECCSISSKPIEGTSPFKNGIILDYGYIDSYRVMRAVVTSFMTLPSGKGLIKVTPKLYVFENNVWIDTRYSEAYNFLWVKSGIDLIEGRQIKVPLSEEYDSFTFAQPTALVTEALFVVGDKVLSSNKSILKSPITLEKEEVPLTKNCIYSPVSPKNIIICFGRVPEINWAKYNYVVFKGWKQDTKDCLVSNNFSRPIILSDNPESKSVKELARRFEVTPRTYKLMDLIR